MSQMESLPVDRLEEIRQRLVKSLLGPDYLQDGDVEWLIAEVERLRGPAPGGGSPPQEDARQIVNEQAEDEALWAPAATASEAFVQSALRRLHAAVERVTGDETDPLYLDLCDLAERLSDVSPGQCVHVPQDLAQRILDAHDAHKSPLGVARPGEDAPPDGKRVSYDEVLRDVRWLSTGWTNKESQVQALAKIDALATAALRGTPPSRTDGWTEAQTGHNETVAMCEAAIATALQTWSNTTKDQRTVDDVIRDALASVYVPSRGGPTPSREQPPND